MLFGHWGGSASPLIKQLPLSLPDSCPMLFLKFTALGWKDCMSCRHHGFLIDLNLYQSLYALFVKLAFCFFLLKLPLVVLCYFLYSLHLNGIQQSDHSHARGRTLSAGVHPHKTPNNSVSLVIEKARPLRWLCRKLNVFTFWLLIFMVKCSK